MVRNRNPNWSHERHGVAEEGTVGHWRGLGKTEERHGGETQGQRHWAEAQGRDIGESREKEGDPGEREAQGGDTGERRDRGE